MTTRGRVLCSLAHIEDKEERIRIMKAEGTYRSPEELEQIAIGYWIQEVKNRMERRVAREQERKNTLA